MIFITQLIYVRPGKEEMFHEFEDMVMPLIANYRGEVVLRMRPDETAFIEKSIAPPYEVHIIQFSSDTDLESYLKDDIRVKFLYLKEASIESAILFKGVRL